MSALLYLYFTKQKNRIKECFHSPSKLIFPLVALALICMSIFMGSESAAVHHQYRSIDEFLSIVFLIYTLLFVDISKNGFSNGAAFFTMADINLLFVSPIKSAGILFYGIIQQLGRSLYMGVIILLQYSLSHEYYGIGVGTMVVVALGYGITAFLSQMCSMLIYVFTSSSEKKVKLGKAIYYSAFALLTFFVIIKSSADTPFDITGVLTALQSDALYLTPVSGLVSLLVEGVVKGAYLKAGSGIFLILVFILVFYLLISKNKDDYYEDVLSSAEISSSAINSSKESTGLEGLSRSIKKGRTGLSEGWGASAISVKHKTENRRGGLLVTGRMSVVTIAMTVGYSFVVEGDNLTVFILSLYSMLIGVTAGRWMKELSMPYVYLIPEKPFKKLLHIVREQIPVIVIESLLLFAVLHFVRSLNIYETAAMALSRISFGILFIASNLLFLKIARRRAKTVLTVLLYTILSTVCALPAAITGFYMSMIFWAHPFVSYLVTVPVNLIIFALVLYLCRNILENSEFNNN